MAVAAIRLESVGKSYGTVQAVKAVNLTVYEGEFFALLGASGSGKTSLLRLIGGFEVPDSGSIWLGQENISRLPAHRRNVHTVFQDYALFPHLSVADNVAYPLRLKQCLPSEIAQRVTDALTLVKLADLGDRKPDQLSGGQRQRVALARAIVDRPAVLLLDEPLSALDAKIRVELREELKLLQRQTGISFIYITHDQEEALTLSDRVAVMKTGEILQVGTPVEIYEKPANRYVAAFVGQANFLSGVLVEQVGERAQVQVGDYQISGTLTSNLPLGSALQWVIRPENVSLSNSPENGSYPAILKQVQYLGFGTRYLLHLADHPIYALQLRHRGTIPFTEGEKLWISWDWTEAMVFSA
jgi:ABC-type Fe3+/spermidine/putrescine transport system ATPase subunit